MFFQWLANMPVRQGFFFGQNYLLVKGTLSRVDMRERPIQNLKKSAFQVERSHFQYGVD